MNKKKIFDPMEPKREGVAVVPLEEENLYKAENKGISKI